MLRVLPLFLRIPESIPYRTRSGPASVQTTDTVTKKNTEATDRRNGFAMRKLRRNTA